MAVDYFITDGERVCPEEFGAFWAAKEAATEYSLKLLDQAVITPAEEAEAERLHAEARRLEKLARTAFLANHSR